LLAAALTNPIPPRSNDDYEVNEPVTPTPEQRRQQRPLRRTHIEAASAGISPPPRVRFAEKERSEQRLTHDFEEDLGSSTPLVSSSQHYSPEAEGRPHRALRISRNTQSAIRYALEEALRHPNPFTPDLIEENASMSDLIGGGPSTSAGNGRGNNGGSRAQASPGTTGSPSIKGPRDIMRERTAREARRKAEQEAKEALERSRAEEEARLAEEDRRRSAERRAAAAAGAAGGQRGSGQSSAQRGSGGTTGQRVSDNSQRSARRSDGGVSSGERPQERPQEQPLQGLGRGGRAVGGGEPATSSRPRPTQPRPVQPDTVQSRPTQAEAGPSTAPGPSTNPPSQPGAAPTRSSFPHAFERWETLSAHWEGLTSFWIRRLEENSNDLNRDPLSQQLSRQVTDLSAAGANLFHAVVELQRLRASSERKFQRWFFETRAEQERAQEIQAMTEASLEQERRERAAAIADAVAKEREKSTSDKQLAEMKRELQISKEEARRAWEELGRREQEERERTASLRDGQPTLVGGVQVVPMMQGVPSRHGSARDRPPTRESPYTGGATSGQAAQEPEGPVDEPDIAYQQFSRAQRSDPTDPFVDSQQRVPITRETRSSAAPNTTSAPYSPEYSQAPAVQPATTSQFYQQHQGISLHPVAPPGRSEHDPSYGPSVPSEGAFSEEEYEIDSQGQFIRDSRGNKVRYQAVASDDGSDDYDVTVERQRELANLQRYGQVTGVEYGRGSTATTGRVQPPTSHPASTEPGAPDYTGQGYGSGPGWEAVPRHHHPTRLSDVLEEDERSRTSASQVSRRE
jgi:hypothetical protein